MVDPVSRLFGFGPDYTSAVGGPTERAAAIGVDRPEVVAWVAWEACRSRLGPGSPSGTDATHSQRSPACCPPVGWRNREQPWHVL